MGVKQVHKIAEYMRKPYLTPNFYGTNLKGFFYKQTTPIM
jgi:hypothetical protein